MKDSDKTVYEIFTEFRDNLPVESKLSFDKLIAAFCGDDEDDYDYTT